MDELREQWDRDGYVVVSGLLDGANTAVYAGLYQRFISGEIDASSHRHDLGSNEEQKLEDDENVMQIMWPSLFADLARGPLHTRALAISQALLGADVGFDFDMLIHKEAHTDTAVPWHSDEGYWPADIPDKRAASVWVALADASVDMGCMWFVPGSHRQPLRPHRPAAAGSHVLTVDGVTEADGVAVPIPAGSATIHSGRTLHYTRGNSTARPRPAFIANYRPLAMVQWEREHGFDHGAEGVHAFEYDMQPGYGEGGGPGGVVADAAGRGSSTSTTRIKPKQRKAPAQGQGRGDPAE